MEAIMPELPEVEAIRREIEPKLIARRIERVEILLPRILRGGEAGTLGGAEVHSVERRGKYILLTTTSDIVLFIHLGMTGTLLWNPAPDRFDRFIRAVIYISNERLLFRDIRTFGGLWISTRSLPPWKSMAPDPLEEAFTIEYLAPILLRRKSPIKSTLLDQAVVSGIGNIYASEILFRAGIDPRAICSALGRKRVARIVTESRNVLTEAVAASGTTFRDFRLSDGRNGEFQNFLKVYGRAGEPCKFCGTPIRKMVQAQRSTFYCPRCQRQTRVSNGPT
jgi:formamidopyrimidine-DNA glycosylase